jgi:hypothetical protein
MFAFLVHVLPLTCARCSVCAVSLLGAPVHTDEQITTAEMLAWFQVRQRYLDGRQCALHHIQMYGIGEPPPAHEAITQERLLVYEAQWQILRKNASYRVEREFVNTSYSGKQMIGREVVNTWSGDCAVTKGFIPDIANPNTMIYDTEPPPAHQEGEWRYWLGAQLWSNDGLWSIADLLNRHGESVPEISVNGETIWTVELSDTMKGSLAARRGSRGIELAWMELEVHYAPGFEAETLFSNDRVQYEPPCESDAMLPSRAIVTRIFPARDGKELDWGMAVVTLAGTRVVNIDASTFRPLPANGADVWDGRYRIGYTLGQHYLNVDGRLLRTRRPLEGDVGANLADWVSEGTWIDKGTLDKGDASVQRDNTSLFGRVPMQALALAAIVGGAVIVVRSAVRARQ